MILITFSSLDCVGRAVFEDEFGVPCADCCVMDLMGFVVLVILMEATAGFTTAFEIMNLNLYSFEMDLRCALPLLAGHRRSSSLLI